MSHRPSTPPKPRQTPSSMTHPSASLPPRPPPAQGPARKTPAPIVPALPLLGAKKSFTNQPLGRGHSSLPPKPVFPGKPLPRETDAIVLTPGDGNKPSSYTPTSKPKRAFAAGGDSNNPRPMDPAVTNLTPQNSVSPSASHSGHHSIPHTITPPADLIPGMKSLNLGQTQEPNGHTSPRSPTGPRNRQPYNNINGTMDGPHETSSGLGPRPNYVGDYVHNHPINHLRPQQSSPTQHQDGFPHSQFAGPPHLPHHNNFFYPQPFHPSGTLTPPNSGTMFVPPPMQAQMDGNIFGPDMGGNRLPNGNHHRSFSPPYGLPFQPDHPHPGHHPAMHHFYPPHGPPNHGLHLPESRPIPPGPMYHQQPIDGMMTPDGGNVPQRNEPAAAAAAEEFKRPSSGNVSDAPPSQPAEDNAPGSECTQVTFPNGDRSYRTAENAASRLEAYCLSQFLEDKLSDVTLVLINPTTGDEKRFAAHSFILGRSEKLHRLIASARSQQETDAGLYGHQVPREGMVIGSLSGRTLLKFYSGVDQETFQLALKWLYGAPDWNIEAYLDFNHPSHTTEELSLQIAANNESMIERAVQLLKTSLLLGLDDLVYKSFNNIRNWGFSIDSAGFERMIKFLTEEAPLIQKLYGESERYFWAIPDNMMNEAVAYFSTTFPKNFKLDLKAPNSKYLVRFFNPASPSATGTTTPTVRVSNSESQYFTRVSTILLSIAFPTLKAILENEYLFPTDQKKNRFDLASSVIQERERRRKREIKILMDVGVKGDELDGEGAEKSFLAELKGEDSDLFWEESVVTTFGHGGIGIEVTKRKKGSPGGKVLWKVGKK